MLQAIDLGVIDGLDQQVAFIVVGQVDAGGRLLRLHLLSWSIGPTASH